MMPLDICAQSCCNFLELHLNGIVVCHDIILHKGWEFLPQI